MDVQRIGRAAETNKTQKKEQVAKESVSFQDVMSKKRTTTLLDKLTAMSAEIEDQGKKLADSRTVEDLRKYKGLVKKFMEEAVNNGLQLEDQRGFNRRGRTKVYKIVKEIDTKLIDLTNQVLDKEKKGLAILGTIGEIQGLIINVYS
ncbi:YaaR family protein [Jeotgalibacillus haloalkalitolerans]|uniref:YaaR family protein n=1 Tax=Jeotgalibacillus haloalkalitolerans TaxID=3104292 RepID=A0ABU5KJP3_9BACL|nr:YaaR family protein [Jeotgalibacillus sp. HH7-29]MDZ5711474.1 YaaR family protein [Jeotgalibacillus sp. HH7-29]